MREILFRGKRTDNGEWIFGSIIHQTDYYGDKCDRWFIIEGNDTNDYDIDYPIEVQKETVGQYTGVNDTYDKPIFEGDIVLSVSGKAYEVKFGEGSFYMNGASIAIHHSKWFTVIGNRWDNPERIWRADNV